MSAFEGDVIVEPTNVMSPLPLSVMKPAPLVSSLVLVGMVAPVMVNVPSEFVDVVMFVPPDTLSVSVLKFKVCVVDVSSANSNEAELVLDPSPATIGIPPGVTPSEILSVLSPLGLAS